MKVLLAVFDDSDAAVVKLFRSAGEDPVPYMQQWLTTWIPQRKVPVAFKTYEFDPSWTDTPLSWVAADPNPLMVMVYPVVRKEPGIVDVLVGHSAT